MRYFWLVLASWARCQNQILLVRHSCNILLQIRLQTFLLISRRICSSIELNFIPFLFDFMIIRKNVVTNVVMGYSFRSSVNRFWKNIYATTSSQHFQIFLLKEIHFALGFHYCYPQDHHHCHSGTLFLIMWLLVFGVSKFSFFLTLCYSQ